MYVVCFLVGLMLAVAGDAGGVSPALDFRADPIVTTPGGSVTLSWTGTDVDACSAAGGWEGPRPATGGESVSPVSTTTYRLACSGPAGVVEKALTVTVKGEECEQLETCVLDGSSPGCRFPLTVTEQEIVRVAVHERDPGLSARWLLVTADGTPASDCGVPRESSGADCGPLAAGTYTIELSAASGTGTAAVHVQHLTGCNGTRIDCDQVVTDTIDPGEDSDVIRLTVGEAEMLRITVQELGGSLSAEWRLLTAAGEPASSCESFRRATADDCGPLAAGEYQLQLRDEFAQGAGSFAVHLQRLAVAQACDSAPFGCEQTVTGEIAPGLESDLFRFTLEEQEVARIAIVVRDGPLAPEWRLLTAAGLPAPACGSLTTQPTAACGPLPAGTYQVQVKDAVAQGTGGYELSLGPCAVCGDSLVTSGEECDPPGACCTATCRLESAGTMCRASEGDCDVVESCTGTDRRCPTDIFLIGGAPCRPAADICDRAETCTGRSAACPADGFASGLLCRGALGECDQPETCPGTRASCPPDRKRTTVCRGALAECDAVEFCDGVSNLCPPDRLTSQGTVCRPAAHACDAAETCTGDDSDCPPNLLVAPVCGDGCTALGEQCGEPGLGECPEGQACVSCGCAACVRGILGCGEAPGGDGVLGVNVILPVGSRPLGAAEFTLGWDPTLLRLDAIDGGVTPDFAAAPSCNVDHGAGSARCTAVQTTNSSGPTGSVYVAHPRFSALGPAARRAPIVLTLHSLVDTLGAAITSCGAASTCQLPECNAAVDCADGDECTAETCVGGSCMSSPPGGFRGADCELAKLLAVLGCGSEPIEPGLARLIVRTVSKARHLLARAEASDEGGKRARRVRRVAQRLEAVQRRTRKLTRSGKISAECGATIEQLVGQRRQLIVGLVS